MATIHYKIASELEPHDGEIQYNFGVILDSMGRLQEAEERYALAIKNGVQQAEKNLRNVRVRILGKAAGASA
jgi:Tfp pilus assembly protein PilF